MQEDSGRSYLEQICSTIQLDFLVCDLVSVQIIVRIVQGFYSSSLAHNFSGDREISFALIGLSLGWVWLFCVNATIFNFFIPVYSWLEEGNVCHQSGFWLVFDWAQTVSMLALFWWVAWEIFRVVQMAFVILQCS